MNNILFVSYNHGNENVADSVQNHRLIPALKKYFDINVIQRKVNKSSVGIWSPNIYIIDRVIYKLFPYLFSIFSLDRLLWCIITYNKIKKIIPDYQYLIMVYEPYTIRYLQYLIHNKYKKLKIITLLYDPYVDNIFMGKEKIGEKIRARIESKIVNLSDLVVAYNNKHYNLIKNRYPYARVFGSVFCGMPSMPVDINKYSDKDSCIKTLIHVGNIYGERKINCLNTAISVLKQKMSRVTDHLHIAFYGTYCVGYEKVIEAGNDDVITHSSPLYGSDLQKVINNADGLLLIDPMDERNTCIPSKLCEYYQFKKPIFGFSAKGTPSYESLKESGNIVCDESEIDIMVESLMAFSSCSLNFVSPKKKFYDEQFYPAEVAKKLYNIILQA